MTIENLNINPLNQEENNPFKTKFVLLLFFNIILIIAVFVFLGLSFLKCKQPQTNCNKASILSEIKSSSIVFVNFDTLITNYELTIELRKNLEKEKHQLEADFNIQKATFDREVQSFQKKIQTNSIKADEAQITEKKLQEKQQQLYELNENYTNRLAQKEMETNSIIKDSISNFLQRNYKKKYDYILAYSPGTTVLLANEKHEITADVLKALNDEYKNKRHAN